MNFTHKRDSTKTSNGSFVTLLANCPIVIVSSFSANRIIFLFSLKTCTYLKYAGWQWNLLNTLNVLCKCYECKWIYHETKLQRKNFLMLPRYVREMLSLIIHILFHPIHHPYAVFKQEQKQPKRTRLQQLKFQVLIKSCWVRSDLSLIFCTRSQKLNNIEQKQKWMVKSVNKIYLIAMGYIWGFDLHSWRFTLYRVELWHNSIVLDIRKNPTRKKMHCIKLNLIFKKKLWLYSSWVNCISTNV